MTTLPPKATLLGALQTAFYIQRRHALQIALTTAGQRIERIRRLQVWIRTHEAAIQQALYDDFRKPAAEVVLGVLP